MPSMPFSTSLPPPLALSSFVTSTLQLVSGLTVFFCTETHRCKHSLQGESWKSQEKANGGGEAEGGEGESQGMCLW